MNYNVTLGQSFDNQKTKFDILKDFVSKVSSGSLISYFTFDNLQINKIPFVCGHFDVGDNLYLYSYLYDTLEPNILSNRAFVDFSIPLTLDNIFEALVNLPLVYFYSLDSIQSFIGAHASDIAFYSSLLTHSNESNSEIICYFMGESLEDAQTVYKIEFFNATTIIKFSRETIDNNEGVESSMSIKRKIDLGFTVKNGRGSIFPNTLKEVQIAKPTDPDPDFAALSAKVAALAPLIDEVFGASAHIVNTDVRTVAINYPVFQAANPSGESVKVGKVTYIANFYEMDATGAADDNTVETGGSFNGVPMAMSQVEIEEVLPALLEEMYGYCNNGTTKRFHSIAWVGNIRPIIKK